MKPASNRPSWRQRAFDQAQKGGYSVMIIDTAGRSQLDDALMDELRAITAAVTDQLTSCWWSIR